ncbi:MAG: chemotaxis protein CheC, partial [Candidatus Omnitrophota bacterium]
MVDLNFSPIQLDALREIGNVGAGNAATALGQLMNKIVSINIPEVRFLRLDQLDDAEFFKEPQELNIAICSRILGTLRGGALVLFSKKSSLL